MIVLRVFFNRVVLHPIRKLGTSLGEELFCVGMAHPMVEKLIAANLTPFAVGQYHLMFKDMMGNYVDLLFEGKAEDDDMVLFMLQDSNVSVVREEDYKAEKYQYSHELWKTAPLGVKSHLPNFR